MLGESKTLTLGFATVLHRLRALVFNLVFIILLGNKENHKSLGEFGIRQDRPGTYD